MRGQARGILAIAAAAVAFTATAGAATAAVPAIPGVGDIPDHVQPAPSGATTQLVGVHRVAQDVDRYSYRYGPLVSAPGHNLVLIGPVVVQHPPCDGYSVRFKPDLVRASDGTTPPLDQMHMHHAIWMNMSRTDATDPSRPQLFQGFAEEKTIGTLPYPFGYPIAQSDVIGLFYMLHNETPVTQEVYVTWDWDWVCKDSARGRTMKPAYPLWMDVRNGDGYPVFDALRGAGHNGRFTYPDDAHDPYKGDPAPKNEYKVPDNGVLVATAGHLHPGGLYTDLDVVRNGQRALAFRSYAHYFDKNGPVSWNVAMDVAPPNWRVGVHKGDILRESVTYDTSKYAWYESMGINGLYISYADSGPDPFKQSVITRGSPTHGELPEARHEGGEASGLPDPRNLPDGPALNGPIMVGDFTYLGGNLGSAGSLGLPPVVQPGQKVQFVNGDDAGQIFHTITACKAPCNGAAGIGYPLADAKQEFDSGQLGISYEYNAAVGRDDFTVPTNLKPGTYTYFCRVHPFMRGSFRVAGTPESDATTAKKRRSRVHAAGGRRLLVDRHGRVHVKLRCSTGGGCAGKVSLKRGRTIAGRRYRLAAGHSRSITLQLSRKARRLLAHRRRVTATLLATTAANRSKHKVVLERRR